MPHKIIFPQKILSTKSLYYGFKLNGRLWILTVKYELAPPTSSFYEGQRKLTWLSEGWHVFILLINRIPTEMPPRMISNQTSTIKTLTIDELLAKSCNCFCTIV